MPPRRSVLYMPGSNARALEKAKTLPADGFIFDLEDSVAPDAKDTARHQVRDALHQNYTQEIIIRMNGMNTPWGAEDLKMIADTKANAILIPKVESPSQIYEIEQSLPLHMQIWCMMETPLGMLNAREIAGASERLTCLVMGTSDLAKDLHAHHTALRLPMITSLGLCLLAARAHHLSILDGVYLDLEDEEGFAYACQQGLELGFDGKTLIHPKTIETTNRIFTPSDTEIEQAYKIMQAHHLAQQEGKGVVVVDGKLIENLHVQNAQRLIQLAQIIASPK